MSASIITRMRKERPYLTPGFASDNEGIVSRPDPAFYAQPLETPNIEGTAPVMREAAMPEILSRRSPLEEKMAYLRDVQGGGRPNEPLVRKPSKLQTGLGIAFSFLGAGLPGAAGYLMQRFNPQTWQNAEVNAAQQQVNQELMMRKAENADLETSYDVMRRQAEIERLQRPPEENVPVGGRIINRRTGAVIYEPPAVAKPKRTQVVKGVLLEETAPGEWEPKYAAPEKAVEPKGLTPYQQQEYRRRESKRRGELEAARAEYNDLVEQEKQAEGRKKAAYDALQALPASTERPFLTQATEAAAAAQREYAGYEAKKNAALGKIRSLSIEEPSTPAPSTHGFSIRAWLSRNPGKSEADAKAYAAEKYKGYRIVP